MRRLSVSKSNLGFTLIELLVVISIIALISSGVLFAVNTARQKAVKEKKIADMIQTKKMLELYFNDNGSYPNSDGDGLGGWDVGNKTFPWMNNVFTAYNFIAPRDQSATGNSAGYFYYRYAAGTSGCDPNKGGIYILGFTRGYQAYPALPESPGFSCPSRNWQTEFEWVMGGFEK